MKRSAITLFALMSLFFSVSTSVRELRAETIIAKGFTLEIPDSWEVIQEEKTIFTVRAPQDHADDSFGENIRVLRHSVGKAFTADEVLARQKSNTGRFKLIGEGKVEAAKIPMVWMAIAPKTPRDDRDRLVKIDFISTFGTDIVVLTAMAEPEVWQTYLPTFKKIVSSFAPASRDEP